MSKPKRRNPPKRATVTLEHEQAEAVDRLAAALTKMHGVEVTRSGALRYLIKLTIPRPEDFARLGGEAVFAASQARTEVGS